MRPWHLGVLIACVVVLSVGTVTGVVLYFADQRADEQTIDQIAACERGNTLRRQVDEISNVVEEFTKAAAETREAASRDQTANAEAQRRDAAAAARYAALAERLQPVQQVPCANIIGRR